MSDNPIQLVVAAFQDEKSAKAALKELKAAQKAKMIKIESAAVLRKDKKGKLHIKETGDLSGGQGAMFGGALGLTLGILAGPGALVAGAAGAGPGRGPEKAAGYLQTAPAGSSRARRGLGARAGPAIALRRARRA